MSEILPIWLLKDIPDVSACGLLGYDDIEDIFWVRSSDESSLKFYDSMTEAMKDYGMDCCNLSVHESVSSRYRIVNNCLINDSASEVFFVKNDNLQMMSLEQDFQSWQNFYHRVKDGNDWRAAYHLIETLPLLWKPISAPPTFLWNRNSGHDYLDETVIDESVILDLYFPEQDFSLNVLAENFEQAYLSLGKKIVQNFSVEDCSLISVSFSSD